MARRKIKEWWEHRNNEELKMKKKDDKLGLAEIWIDGELVETVQISFPSQLWRAMDKLPNNSIVICKWTNGKQKTFKVSR